ncbi:MAG: TIGR04076 family protein [Magnetococcales bacterium]|nr:TIGR04076 family protein [Magnetococcales bacterium]
MTDRDGMTRCRRFNRLSLRMRLDGPGGRQSLTLAEILPGGLCPLAFHAIYPYVLTLARGGWFNWVGFDEHVIVHCPASQGVAFHVKAPGPGAADGVVAEVLRTRGEVPCGYPLGRSFTLAAPGPALAALDHCLTRVDHVPATGGTLDFVVEEAGQPCLCRVDIREDRTS